MPANYNDNLVYGFKFNLNNFNPDARLLLSIYDEYRISKVKVSIRPDFRNRTAAVPMEVLTIDHDDALVTGQTYTDLINYAGARVGPTGYKTKTFVPRWKGYVQDSTGTAVADALHTSWLDSAAPDVDYYGFKTGYQNSFVNTVSFTVVLMYKIWVEYRYKR